MSQKKKNKNLKLLQADGKKETSRLRALRLLVRFYKRRKELTLCGR